MNEKQVAKELVKIAKNLVGMIPVSDHLHEKEWQLAVTNDRTLPVRKWNHLGTVRAVSALSAVHSMGKNVVKEVRPVDGSSAVYLCSDGSFVRVH